MLEGIGESEERAKSRAERRAEVAQARRIERRARAAAGSAEQSEENDRLDAAIMCLPLDRKEVLKVAAMRAAGQRAVPKRFLKRELSSPWKHVEMVVNNHFWTLWVEAGAEKPTHRTVAMCTILRGEASPVPVAVEGFQQDGCVTVSNGLRIPRTAWVAAMAEAISEVVDDWRFFAERREVKKIADLTQWDVVETNLSQTFWGMWAKSLSDPLCDPIATAKAVLSGYACPVPLMAELGEAVVEVGSGLRVGRSACIGGLARLLPWALYSLLGDIEETTPWGECEDEVAQRLWQEWLTDSAAACDPVETLRAAFTRQASLLPFRRRKGEPVVHVKGYLTVGLDAWCGAVAATLPSVADSWRGTEWTPEEPGTPRWWLSPDPEDEEWKGGTLSIDPHGERTGNDN